MTEDDNFSMTAGEMLAIIEAGWRTEEEHKVLCMVRRRLTKMADDVFKRFGARCEKCGHPKSDNG